MNSKLFILSSIFFIGCSSKTTPISTNQADYKVKNFPTTIYHNISKDETKRVELYAPKLKFKALDGRSYESQFNAGMQMFVKKYHSVVLKEGEHQVKFYYDIYSVTNASLNFQEGHKYLFDFYISSYRS
jgi:hypothetical protein